MVVALLALLGVGLLPLGVLTGLGARRRGASYLVALVSGTFYPVTWAVWYLRDEHPYRAAAGLGTFDEHLTEMSEARSSGG